MGEKNLLEAVCAVGNEETAVFLEWRERGRYA
jgi:hypothetical protein